MSLQHRYAPDGYTLAGRRIPDIPVVSLTLVRRDRRTRASGPAILDTGFDGGILPSLQLLTFFEGLAPRSTERLAGPFGDAVPCEVFQVTGTLASGDTKRRLELREVNVYIPVEPDYLGQEVLVGREILNTLALHLNGKLATMKKAH